MEYKAGMILEHYGEHYENYYNAIVPPIFMNSLHVFDSIDDYYDLDVTGRENYCYGRVQNPTVRILEDKIAALESGEVCYVFSSGMAAATTAVLSVCTTGGHVICVKNAYGPLKNFLVGYCKEHMNIETTFVEGTQIEEFENALRETTQLIVLESPSSVVFSVQDIAKVSELAKKRNVKVYIDNTYCTPIYQRPLELGVDIVMHTTSKYLGGHSDLIGGALIMRDRDLAEKIRNMREQLGSIIGPMEGWLILRGLRTLEVRVKEHERTATDIAEWLKKHPKVRNVYYTGISSHPQAELIKKQQSGSTGLLSFEIDGTVELAKKFCEELKVFKIGVSWGGFESLVMMPYARQSEEEAKTMGGSSNIIRIHCGLEGNEILKQDLANAFDAVYMNDESSGE